MSCEEKPRKSRDGSSTSQWTTLLNTGPDGLLVASSRIHPLCSRAPAAGFSSGKEKNVYVMRLQLFFTSKYTIVI